MDPSGVPTKFLFSTPYTSEPVSGVYNFAQGVTGNVWQAENIQNSSATPAPVVVDYIDVGDAFETARLRQGAKVRLELALYQDLINKDTGEAGGGTSLTAFSMDLLAGAKGKGKPTASGPTELQGARLASSKWTGEPYKGDINDESLLGSTTYESNWATIYAAKPPATTEDTADSYMSLSIQTVTGLGVGGDPLTGLSWNGSIWVDTNGGDSITAGGNLFTTNFGPELNIAGKYIVGASGSPFTFTADGFYLVTFALDESCPISFDENTKVGNFLGADLIGDAAFGAPEGRQFSIIADGTNHNGLAYAIVQVPSQISGG